MSVDNADMFIDRSRPSSVEGMCGVELEVSSSIVLRSSVVWVSKCSCLLIPLLVTFWVVCMAGGSFLVYRSPTNDDVKDNVLPGTGSYPPGIEGREKYAATSHYIRALISLINERVIIIAVLLMACVLCDLIQTTRLLFQMCLILYGAVKLSIL